MKLDIFHDSGSPQKSRNLIPAGDATESSLATRYYPLVGAVVNRMRPNLPPNADLEELHSIGVSGLMAAVQRYDKEQAITFHGYAATKIRGAILDELRKLDTLPRTRRAKYRNLNKAVEELEQHLGRVPRDSELAEKLGMSTGDLCRLQEHVRPCSIVSLDAPADSRDENAALLHETIADDSLEQTSARMEKREIFSQLSEQLAKLPERQRSIVTMYYFEGKRLAEIAEVFGVTEARVCQIHTQAVNTLRQSLLHAAA